MKKFITNISLLLVILFIVVILISLKNTKKISKMDFVSPYVVLASLQSNKRVLLVNVLGDKIPFNLDCENSNNSISITKDEFENSYIKNYNLNNSNLNNSNLNNIDLIILYCASWSCGAAKQYYKQLEKKGINMDKIFDYKGAIHEWSTYSLLFPSTYKMKNLKTKNTANREELIKLVNDTKHTYLLKDEKKSKHKIIKILANYYN